MTKNAVFSLHLQHGHRHGRRRRLRGPSRGGALAGKASVATQLLGLSHHLYLNCQEVFMNWEYLPFV